MKILLAPCMFVDYLQTHLGRRPGKQMTCDYVLYRNVSSPNGTGILLQARFRINSGLSPAPASAAKIRRTLACWYTAICPAATIRPGHEPEPVMDFAGSRVF